MLSKSQIITNIQQLNRSAKHDWLDRFDAMALRRYLDHLQHAQEPRGGDSIWIRDGETHAVVTRAPAA